MSVAVAQAMRYAGCPNRRSLGVSDVSPLNQSWRFSAILLRDYNCNRLQPAVEAARVPAACAVHLLREGRQHETALGGGWVA